MKESLAKPSGITLQQHIKNVLAEGIYIHNTLPISFQKYSKTVNKDLFKRLNGAIKFHDDGKLHTKWQNACRNDYEEFLKWHSLTGKNFNEYSKYFKDLAGKNLRNSRVRHEINSLTRHIGDSFSNPVKVAIAAHHSKLGRRFEDRWTNNNSGEKSSDLWNEFINLNACYRNLHQFKDAIKKHYEFSGVRAYLQLADRRASAKEDNGIYIPLRSFEYNFPFDEKRNVQKIVEDHLNEDFLLIRAPTGSGKTDASLLWASSQIANHKAERLIIAMPTRFTSNALSINVAGSLSDTGLYHSSAWNSKFHKQVKEGFLKKEIAKKEHELARQLLVPVTVCTIDHLLIALTLTREDHHSIVFNLSNSCVVIDEADFYDEFTQANILVLLEALNVLKVPVMVMSASLPESSLLMYQSTGYKVGKIYEDTSDNKRIRCIIDEIIEYEEVKEIDDQLQICLDKGCAIIYANTVAKAMRFYRWFEERNIKPILYHSRFTEPDKAKREELLLSALGKDAWNSGTAKGIIIMTQIGEISVNISADLMLSDLCPIDRLVQRVGRLCRFSDDKIGILKLLIPLKGNTLYPAPYGTFVQKNGWKANEALVKTRKLLKLGEYSAEKFVDLINKVYPSFEKFQMKAKHNAELLKSKFINNWIILPLEATKEDDTESSEWKTRDIKANDTVFIDFPESDYFHNWSDFIEYKLEYGIDLPVYLIKKGIMISKIVTHQITIDEENKPEIIYVALNCYSQELGLQIEFNSTEDQFL
ncbi:MAG: CRISPR-associated helicase Cas3' [Hydrotalea flava]|uniref:CRISPR-associated helicase Cas3' n=1 Tax=Hydrotalea lipotrueae TaxID=2803817 RepID=UPI001C491792|nr:CRISPR-associated helicase Cas3' [Hydrotalea lipotrueae]MBY0347385.1 CRISPR-associated helicase Cas3' [Hydrotalea flava]